MSGQTYKIPKQGSLGLLAAGHRGLDAWREVRGTDWIEAQRIALEAMPAAAPGEPALSGDLDIVVVSGLPRSGTSMAMQMLVAGGLDAYTDAEREADPSNPKGYFEHASVRALASDHSWIPDVDGRVVKIVAPLPVHLPPGPRYRIVLMERDVEEVLASQSAMLNRSGEAAADAAVLRPAYLRFMAETRAWTERTENVSLLTVPHADAISQPTEVARRLAAFAGSPEAPLDADAMASVVDASLHRQKSR